MPCFSYCHFFVNTHRAGEVATIPWGFPSTAASTSFNSERTFGVETRQIVNAKADGKTMATSPSVTWKTEVILWGEAEDCVLVNVMELRLEFGRTAKAPAHAARLILRRNFWPEIGRKERRLRRFCPIFRFVSA
jgi:hypothetical protein